MPQPRSQQRAYIIPGEVFIPDKAVCMPLNYRYLPGRAATVDYPTATNLNLLGSPQRSLHITFIYILRRLFARTNYESLRIMSNWVFDSFFGLQLHYPLSLHPQHPIPSHPNQQQHPPLICIFSAAYQLHIRSMRRIN